MAHVICEPCVGAKHRDCVSVCPVDCIHPKLEEDQGEVMLFINPDECIDCGACVPACPVAAIFTEQDVRPSGRAISKRTVITSPWTGSVSRPSGGSMVSAAPD